MTGKSSSAEQSVKKTGKPAATRGKKPPSELARREAELEIINSIQRGLASKMDMPSIYKLVGDTLTEISGAEVVVINTWTEQNTIRYEYIYEKGQQLGGFERPASPLNLHVRPVLESGKSILWNTGMKARLKKFGHSLPAGELPLSVVIVPLKTSARMNTSISLQNVSREHAFTKADVRLLETLANSMGVALENARLLKETEQRNAELAIINSVQEGLSRQLDLQGIVDLVGEKIGAIFHADTVIASLYDDTRDWTLYSYYMDHGKRTYFPMGPAPRPSLGAVMADTRRPLLLGTTEESEALGALKIASADADQDRNESFLGTPLLVGERVIGMIAVQSYKRHAYNESDLGLLQMLANAMSVALENARLFDETQRLIKVEQERVAELAIINSVQAALAAELNIQGIYDAIGNRIREIFNHTDMSIRVYDPQTSLLHFPYQYENGERFHLDPVRLPEHGFTPHVIRTRKTLVINQNLEEEAKKYGAILLHGEKMEKSMVFVPLIMGDEARGVIGLSDMNRENAFNESNVRLLETLANSMSVALENARLFDETQRLFKAEQERVAELAIINSVQEGLAAKLDMHAIYEMVGTRILEIFHADTAYIAILDAEKQEYYFPYYIDRGRPLQSQTLKVGQGLTSKVAALKRPLLLGTREEQHQNGVRFTAYEEESQDLNQTYLGVPIMIANEAMGVVSVQRYPEHAFNESDVRLLQTLANAMSIALENARLFDKAQTLLKETEQRNAELAIINSVQGALAAQLDMQTIYDLVGEKLREIFDAQGAGITVVDYEQKIIRIPYLFEDGGLFRGKTIPLGKGLISLVLENRQPLRLNTQAAMRQYVHQTVFPGAQNLPKSWLTVPIIIGEQAIGTLNVQNYRREYAFSDSDQRLLETLAASLGVALDNARLFAETQRLLQETEHRAAELAVINAVQQALTSKLDIRSIYESVGDKLREIFNVQTVAIYTADLKTRMIHYEYAFEKGQKWQTKPRPFTGLHAYIVETVLRTHRPVVVNEKFDEFASQFADYQAARSEAPKSMVAVPIIQHGDAITGISLQNLEQEYFFSDSDVRLLETLANAMSVALENARLLDETQRLLKETEERAGELFFINVIGQTLTEELDLNTMIERVGDKLREAFDTKNMGIGLYDSRTNVMSVPYVYRDGVRMSVDSFQLNEFNRRMSLGGRSMVFNRNAEKAWRKTGGITASGETPKSFVLIPLMAGKELVGGITLQDFEREGAFSDLSVSLLETIASNMGTAIQNARLFNEVVRRKEYFEALFLNNPVAVVTIDNNANVTSWNPAAEKLFGYTREEAVGRNVDSLVAKRDDIYEDAVNLSQAGISPQGGAFQSIVKRTRKDGTLVDVELSAVPIIVQGQKQGIYALYHDITELQRARQEAVAANEAKSAFLATMSHEIRTPMNAVIGMSGLLLDTSLNHEQRDYVETIRDSGDSLLNIINDILDFSKIEAGRMDIEAAPFDLRACIESALDLVAARAVQKGLETAYIFEDEVPAAVEGDETRLRQILLNLLSNAVKFTENGEVVLTVSRVPSPTLRPTKNGKRESVSLVFSVRDTGIGLTQEGMGRLFQSFSQADSSTTRKYGGTGLGLAISKRLAELMGGTMWAESEGLNKGSTFTFTVNVPVTDLPAPKRRDISGIQPQLKGRRLLIVDDNATNRRILNMQTSKWGMTTRDTESPHQALEWVRAGERFDLAILDMHMPEMDGLSLARILHQQNNAIPLILFSSLGRRELGEHESQFVAYLTKPLKQSQLFDTLAGIFTDAQPAAPAIPESRRLQLDPELGARHPLRILLAEDNLVNQKLALRILAQMGYHADVAANGEEALRAVQGQPYDLVLMDVQMPEMDGIEATHRIRIMEGIRQPSIVGLTANAMQGDREKCIAAGMNDYITKPIRVEELVRALLDVNPQ